LRHSRSASSNNNGHEQRSVESRWPSSKQGNGCRDQTTVPTLLLALPVKCRRTLEMALSMSMSTSTSIFELLPDVSRIWQIPPRPPPFRIKGENAAPDPRWGLHHHIYPSFCVDISLPERAPILRPFRVLQPNPPPPASATPSHHQRQLSEWHQRLERYVSVVGCEQSVMS